MSDENNHDLAPSKHLEGALEKCMTVAKERHARVVLTKEKKRRSDACDALLAFSKVAFLNSLLHI